MLSSRRLDSILLTACQMAFPSQFTDIGFNALMALRSPKTGCMLSISALVVGILLPHGPSPTSFQCGVANLREPEPRRSQCTTFVLVILPFSCAYC